jgi:hypothetical protein
MKNFFSYVMNDIKAAFKDSPWICWGLTFANVAITGVNVWFYGFAIGLGGLGLGIVAALCLYGLDYRQYKIDRNKINEQVEYALMMADVSLKSLADRTISSIFNSTPVEC